jgi:hypothetical protein
MFDAEPARRYDESAPDSPSPRNVPWRPPTDTPHNGASSRKLQRLESPTKNTNEAAARRTAEVVANPDRAGGVIEDLLGPHA